jgi:hypothetical protein
MDTNTVGIDYLLTESFCDNLLLSRNLAYHDRY